MQTPGCMRPGEHLISWTNVYSVRMFIRSFAIGTVWVSVLACASKPEPRTPRDDEAAVAPAQSPTPPSEPTPPTPPTPSTPVAVANTQLTPPQTWQQIGHRPDQPDIVMGALVWRGGEDFEVDLRGTMKYMLQSQIGDAIKAKPDDPGAAIQGVLTMVNELGGERPMIEWVRVQAK